MEQDLYKPRLYIDSENKCIKNEVYELAIKMKMDLGYIQKYGNSSERNDIKKDISRRDNVRKEDWSRYQKELLRYPRIYKTDYPYNLHNTEA